jgi:hypothetical protein
MILSRLNGSRIILGTELFFSKMLFLMSMVVSVFCCDGCRRQTVPFHGPRTDTIMIGGDAYEVRLSKNDAPVDLSHARLYATSTQPGETPVFPPKEIEAIAVCLGQVEGAKMDIENVDMAWVFGEPMAAEVFGRLYSRRQGFWNRCYIELRKDKKGEWVIVRATLYDR